MLVAAALLTFCSAAAVSGDDAPTVSNKAPFVGEKFTVSGDIGTDGARPVTLESFDEGWTDVADAKTSADGTYRFTTSQKERVDQVPRRRARHEGARQARSPRR